ncbi:cytochrome P450 [Hyaloscypha variabilis F]|uniref:Cytochrome P450 n=1 Tax=Hyaloscypha variabilis (strain UAMH 11265 / GT02V1 / F) TaxID=1149755 RepID=A0A2J6S712_HYAVF|nr:cytochrome P450 [Hyaloscypha variabilis F]
MSNIVASSIAIFCGCAATYYSNDSSATFSYLKAAASSASIYLPLQLIWSCFLYPLYFSPLRKLPQAPRVGGWKSFFTITSPPQVLEYMDTVPHEHFFRMLDIFNKEIVILTDPKAITQPYQTDAYEYVKSVNGKKIIEAILGNGLVVAEGHDHKYQKKHLAPVFNFRVVKNLYPLFWKKSSELVSSIIAEIDTKPNSSGVISGTVDIDEWSGRIGLDIIGKAGFGSDFNAITNPHSPLNTSYREAFIPDSKSALIFLLSVLTYPPLIRLLPLEKNRQVREGMNMVNSYLRDLISQRKSDMLKNVDESDYLDKTGHRDIISSAMKTNAFTTENLVDQSKTLLGAGHETSSVAITFAIYLLSQPKYAHIQQRLRDEIRANLPSPSSGVEVNAELLDKLPYLDAVSKESMRVWSPVTRTSRLPLHDVQICGVTIPKGTTVQMVPWALNKAKIHWGEDAREFNPERWLVGENKANGGAASSLAYATFGTGPRGCIGKGFAIGENKAILAALIGSFDFKPVGGKEQKVDIMYGVTARIVGGLKVDVTLLDDW